MLTRFSRNGKIGMTPINIGHIILPKDVDREAFISMCFKTQTVLISSLDGEMYEDVPVGKQHLNEIDFPDDVDSNGSPVSFAFANYLEWPVILSVYKQTTKIDAGVEGDFKIGKSKNGKAVSIVGNPNNGNLLINVTAEENGLIDIKVDGGENAVVSIGSSGEIRLNSKIISKIAQDEIRTLIRNFDEDKLTKIAYKLGSGLTGVDEFDNTISVAKDGVKIKTEKFKFENNNDYTLKNLIDDIITEVANITVSTSMGQMPILNKIQVEELKNKNNQILE